MNNDASKYIPPQPKPPLSDVLAALGHRAADRVSICTKVPGTGPFPTRVVSVADLTEWSPRSDRTMYFGVLPLARSVRYGRGKEVDVTRSLAVWTDLDVKDECLASLAECHAVADLLVEWLGSETTVRIETGHGLQPIWRVRSTAKQPNHIAEHWPEHPSAGEMWNREQWRAVQLRWGGLVRLAVDQIRPGAKADPVFDLARVLRCPGSVNHKQIEAPVAVRTALNAAAPGVTRRALVRALDAHSIVVAPTAPALRSVPTAPSDALDWINAQPGALADVEEMLQLGRHRSMLDLLDYDGLVTLFSRGSEDEGSAHTLMLKRVQHAVFKATEGYAGLVLALLFIERAYREVMRMRRDGDASGEGRADSVALNDYYRAVVGAVSRARGREAPVPMLRHPDGRIRLSVVREGDPA